MDFLFEPGEMRSTSGQGERLVRFGTRALTTSSRSTLWKRLSQHKGALRAQMVDGVLSAAILYLKKK